MMNLTHLPQSISGWTKIVARFGAALLFLLLLPSGMNGQVTAYTYATSTGNMLDPMTGSTQLIGVNIDDDPSALTPIGFTFNYNGVNYTDFSVTPDGFLKLGSPATTAEFTNSITSIINLPKIMAFWDDFATGTTGQVHYVVTGTMPNRILKVEWFVTIPRNTGGPANSTFQVWLYETTNVIEMRYGNGGNPPSASCGINSTAPVVFQSITTSTHTVSTATANNGNAVWPGLERMYSFTPPACLAPGGLMSGNITTTTADISWNAAPGAVSYDWEVVTPAGSPQGTGVVASGNTASTTVNVTGLTASTSYSFYVRTNCGGGSSTYAGPSSFTTVCTTIPAPYSHNFDANTPDNAAIAACVLTDNIGACWGNSPANTNMWVARSAATPSAGTGPDVDHTTGAANFVYLEASGCNNVTSLLFSPVIDVTPLTVPELHFWYHMFGGQMGTLSVFVSDDGGATYGATPVWTLTGNQGNTWIEAVVPLPGFAGQNDLRFRFNGTTGGGFESDMAIDDFSIIEAPTCPNPFSLMVSNITQTTADVTWSSGGGCTVGTEYWVLVSPSVPPTPGTGTAIGCAPTFPINLTGLMATTTYDVWVYENCGANGTAGPLDLGSFSTLLGTLSNPTACQLGLALGDENCPGQDVFQINVASAPGTMLGTDVLVTDVSMIIGHTWAGDVEVELVSPNGVIVPLTSGNGGNGDNYGNPNDPTCAAVTNFNMTGADGPITTGTAPFIGSYIPEGNFATFNDGSNPVGLWELRVCDNALGDLGTLEYVSITLASPATCPSPSGLSVANITQTSADVTWIPGGACTVGTEYWVLVSPSVAPTPGTGTAVACLPTFPINLTGLMATTTYDVWVYENCGANGTAGPVDLGSFSTLLGVLSNPTACQLGLAFTDDNCPGQDVFQINVASAPGTVLGTDVIVTDVDIIASHTWVADLEVELVSPNGVIVPLTSGNGGSGDNYGDPTDPTCTAVTNFNMTGANGPIALGTAPFIGSFIPDGDFDDFNDGSNPVGLWELRICDNTFGDVGALQYVKITLGAPCNPTSWYPDADMDTYGDQMGNPVLACVAPSGTVADNTDCDDTNMAINPGAQEVCNGIDDDCDTLIDDNDPSVTGQSTWYADTDSDTYGNPASSVLACTQPANHVANNTDCDDTNMAINPGAAEICNNIDDDCSGSPEAATNTWNGMGNGTSWDDAANWSDDIVPLTCQHVVIPATANVTIPAAFEGKGLTLEVANGAVLTMPLSALLHIINP